MHNTNSLHKNTETLKITDHCKLRLLLIGHRVLHNKQSINCTHNNLILTGNQHNRNLRNNQNFIVDISAYRSKCKITESVAVAWNELSQNTKSIKNRDYFKKTYSEGILSAYV